MKVYNSTNGVIIVHEGYIANNFGTRLKGLMFKKSFDKGCGLIILPCNSIHMFFMRFPIDVLFMSKEDKVVGIKENIKPWQLSKVYWAAEYVIELPVGTVQETRTTLGDKLNILE